MVRASCEILSDMTGQAECVEDLDNEITREIFGSLAMIRRQLKLNISRMGNPSLITNEEVQMNCMSLMSLVDLIETTCTRFKAQHIELTQKAAEPKPEVQQEASYNPFDQDEQPA